MKTLLLTITGFLCMLNSNNMFCQDFGARDSLKVSFETNINFAKSSNDSRKESSAGTGTLGLRFERGYLYGSVNFNIYSQNNEIATDSTETKIFGTNLLLPENSSSKISNFSLLLGVKTFYLNEKDLEADTFSFKRFGANIEFKVNNNIWKKDSISSPVTINTFNFNLTYLLLNAKILNTKERIRLILSYGLTTRRLGGDFGLDSNKDLRKKFLGTDKLGFNGSNLGVRLEVSKFYGEMNLTSFNRKSDIAGFSGNQAIISLGLVADLTIAAQEIGIAAKK
jgi:hypothetical protein